MRLGIVEGILDEERNEQEECEEASPEGRVHALGAHTHIYLKRAQPPLQLPDHLLLPGTQGFLLRELFLHALERLKAELLLDTLPFESD